MSRLLVCLEILETTIWGFLADDADPPLLRTTRSNRTSLMATTWQSHEVQRMMQQGEVLPVVEEGTEDEDVVQWIRGERQVLRCADLGCFIFFVVQSLLPLALAVIAIVFDNMFMTSVVARDIIAVTSTASMVSITLSLTIFGVCALASKLFRASHSITVYLQSNMPWTFFAFTLLDTIVVVLMMVAIVLEFDWQVWHGVLVGVLISLISTAVKCVLDKFGYFASINTLLALGATTDITLGMPVFTIWWIACLAFCWTVLWSIGVVSMSLILTINSGCSGTVFFALLYLLFCLVYSTQVLVNLINFQIGHEIGKWWYRSRNSEDRPPVRGSRPEHGYFDSVKLFGSICNGTFLLFLPRKLVERLKFERCCRVPSYGTYAFVYMGKFGYSFARASDRVDLLFKVKRWERIISNKTVRNYCLLLTAMSAMVSSVVGVFYSRRYLIPKALLPSFCLSIVVTFCLSHVILGALGAAANAVVVFFADAPEELRNENILLFNAIESAWSAAFPDDYRRTVSVGYGS